MKRTRTQIQMEINKAKACNNYILVGMLQAELNNTPRNQDDLPEEFADIFNMIGGQHGMGNRSNSVRK